MDWPRTPVERLQDFKPPFCPRRGCKYHTRSEGFRFQKKGTYRTKRRTANPRYLCLGCRSTFCQNAFSLNYYRKRPELLRPVAAGMVAGSAYRQLARSLDCAPATVPCADPVTDAAHGSVRIRRAGGETDLPQHWDVR